MILLSIRQRKLISQAADSLPPAAAREFIERVARRAFESNYAGALDHRSRRPFELCSYCFSWCP
jgi:hypothetical protein